MAGKRFFGHPAKLREHAKAIKQMSVDQPQIQERIFCSFEQNHIGEERDEF